MSHGSAAFREEARVLGQPASEQLPAIAPREWLVCAAISLSLLAASVIISAKKPLWFDEILSLTLASDPSVSHMLSALAHGADGMPPLYYLVAQGWRRLFGNSAASLRLISPVCLSVGVFAAFAALRRGFSVSASAVAVTLAFCTPWILVFQSSDMRAYGMFMGLAGVALWLHLRLASDETITPALFAGAVLCHAALVLCHPYGVLYSAAFLGGLLLWQMWSGRVRLAALAAIACGAATLLLWLPAMVRISAMSRPRSVAMVPEPKSLAASYGFGMHPVLMVLTAGLVVARMAQLKKRPTGWAAQRTLLLVCAVLFLTSFLVDLVPAIAPLSAPLLLASLFLLATKPAGGNRLPDPMQPMLPVALTLLLIPLAAFVISRLLAPRYQGRYMLPSWFGVAILIAAAIDNARVPAMLNRSRRPILWGVLLPAIILLPVIRARRLVLDDVPLFGTSRSAIEALAPAGRAIVVEEPLSFLPLAHAGQASANQYYFMLDHKAALTTAAAHSIINFNLMQVWANYGYLPGHILPPAVFLGQHSSFLVLHAPGYSWFESCCANTPAYRTRQLGWLGNSVLVEVTRTPAGER